MAVTKITKETVVRLQPELSNSSMIEVLENEIMINSGSMESRKRILDEVLKFSLWKGVAYSWRRLGELRKIIEELTYLKEQASK